MYGNVKFVQSIPPEGRYLVWLIPSGLLILTGHYGRCTYFRMILLTLWLRQWNRKNHVWISQSHGWWHQRLAGAVCPYDPSALIPSPKNGLRKWRISDFKQQNACQFANWRWNTWAHTSSICSGSSSEKASSRKRSICWLSFWTLRAGDFTTARVPECKVSKTGEQHWLTLTTS